MKNWDDFLREGPGRRVTGGNRVTHLRDDNRAVRAIWRTLDSARERIWMSMYLLAPDAVGGGTLERLAAAARRGCDVRLVYDRLGSVHLRRRHLADLEAAGGRTGAFHRVWPPARDHGALGVRNHRKLILVDDEAALCGGMNLSEDFAGPQHGDWFFDDTVVFVRGPSVCDLAAVFLRTWQEVTGDPPEAPPTAPEETDGVRVEVLETDPRRPDTAMGEALRAALGRVQASCRIVTPYFVPAPWLSDALVAAVGRGVDVQVMTAGRSDSALARAAGRHHYGPLLRGGVQVFELFGRTLHAKSVALDGAFGLIGSYNLDRWTARHTLDLSLAVADETLARSLEDEFEAFKRDASAFTLARHKGRGWPTRIVHKAAAELAKVL